jgi:hypothetical protein
MRSTLSERGEGRKVNELTGALWLARSSSAWLDIKIYLRKKWCKVYAENFRFQARFPRNAALQFVQRVLLDAQPYEAAAEEQTDGALKGPRSQSPSLLLPKDYRTFKLRWGCVSPTIHRK